jgi:hypothetical protein
VLYFERRGHTAGAALDPKHVDEPDGLGAGRAQCNGRARGKGAALTAVDILRMSAREPVVVDGLPVPGVDVADSEIVDGATCPCIRPGPARGMQCHMRMSLQPDKLARLRALVNQHKVVYEVHPESSMATGQRLAVGFNIELYAKHSAHDVNLRPPSPGCDRCVELWEYLQEIGAAVMPPSDRQSRYQIEGFRPALGYDPKRQQGHDRGSPDVELVLTIRHRDEYNADVDACERGCLDEIVASQKSLGVQEGSWSGPAKIT